MVDKNSYLSRVTYNGGQDSYDFPFSYLRKDFVKAQIDVSEHESNTLAYLVDYTIDGQTIELKKPVDADKTITIYRETSSTPLVEYEDSSILRAYDLNLSQRQNLNILEEQTDIVEKNYSLSQDTKDYMYKNLMDTKTAIDNKMSETLDSVNTSVSTMNDIVNTTKKSVEDSLAEMNTTVANTKKSVEDSLATTTTNLNDIVNNTKKSVEDSLAEMNTTVANTKKSVEDSLAEMNTTVANTKKSVEDSLATTTTNLNDAIDTATSSMDNKIAQTSQALKDTENRVNETKADITKLANEFKESESSLQDAIKNINTTNRNMSYEVGDQIHSSYLPFNCYITCVTAGTTGDTLPVIPEGDHDSGFTYRDGTATFKMDYWPLSINGKKPLNKAGDITINVDKVKEAENADTASSVAWSGVTGKPSTYPPSSHNHDSAYPSVTGARASGTWGINVTGNSATATTANTATNANHAGTADSATNATNATKATQDSAGQQINTTYIKGLSVSGATLTITKGNGATSTATINQTAGMLPATRVLQGGGTKLYSYNGGLDSGDITLSQAFTNFKYLVIFIANEGKGQSLHASTVETVALYQAMAGNATYWPGNICASNAETLWLTEDNYPWAIYNIKGGSSTTYFKYSTKTPDDISVYSIYGID